MGFGSVDGIIEAGKRGISKEKVCVACAIDRAGNIIMDLICLGRMTSNQLEDFYGVATKYLSNYLYWFKWLQFFNEDKEIVKSKNFLVHSNSNFVKINIANLKSKAPIQVK